MPIYVRMTDKFMSRWGPARDRTNVYVVECDTKEQADEILAAARQRSEMERVMMVSEAPRERPGVIHTHRHYRDLGAVWKPWTQPREA
jgi:hypothetical protein